MGESRRETGAVVALDVGDARIGVAVSESGVIASTRRAIQRAGRRQTLDALQRVIEEAGAETVVIGLPLLEGGSEGAQVEKTRTFARSLKRRMPGVRVVEWDERHSSGEAREILGRGEADPGRIDSVAAAVLLQEYLDHECR